MAKAHLEAFQHGNRMGIRDGYFLATEHLREVAIAAREEGRLEAAKAFDEARAYLSERLGELDKIHERLEAERKGKARPAPQYQPATPRGCSDGD